MYRDGTEDNKDIDTCLKSDIKNLYEDLIKKENTRAIMFMFGHYIPSFYFRDKDWMGGLLGKIFPENKEKHHLYTAAWEGYLANNLYRELFENSVMQSQYQRALNEKFDTTPQQRHFKEPEEGLGTHLALAFMYYDEFEFGHPLFDALWASDSPAKAKFINFIGRSFVSGSNKQSDYLLKNNPKSRKKLIKLWDWLLKNCANVKVFAEFGFWISLNKDLFELSWLSKNVALTLEKTGGVLIWPVGLKDSLPQFAEYEPEETLKILRLYLLEGGVRHKKNKIPFYAYDAWLEVFKILYSKGKKSIKDGTYKLVDDLICEGGSVFWPLKEALEE